MKHGNVPCVKNVKTYWLLDCVRRKKQYHESINSPKLAILILMETRFLVLRKNDYVIYVEESLKITQ